MANMIHHSEAHNVAAVDGGPDACHALLGFYSLKLMKASALPKLVGMFHVSRELLTLCTEVAASYNVTLMFLDLCLAMLCIDHHECFGNVHGYR